MDTMKLCNVIILLANAIGAMYSGEWHSAIGWLVASFFYLMWEKELNNMKGKLRKRDIW